MPTNTDLVKDLPADFDIFGQAVDDRIKALNPETTAGDISYRASTANAKSRLAIGTAGQVLTVNSGATAPEWANAAGGGKLKQLVEATTTTYFSFSGTSYNDVTGMTASITPTANNSKILILVYTPSTYIGGYASANRLQTRLVRTSTTIFDSAYAIGLGTNNEYFAPYFAYFLDSPATTSSTTYKLQIKNTVSSTSYWNYNGSATEVASFMLLEIGA